MYFKCESDLADGGKSKEEGEKEAVELEAPSSSSREVGFDGHRSP